MWFDEEERTWLAELGAAERDLELEAADHRREKWPALEAASPKGHLPPLTNGPLPGACATPPRAPGLTAGAA